MKPKPYSTIMTMSEVYRLIGRVYIVDTATGSVTRNGKEIKSQPSASGGHFFITLRANDKIKRIAVHRLVWMAGSRCRIPRGWHVHHIDEDVTNNTFENLMCVHPKDHNKLHNAVIDDTPF